MNTLSNLPATSTSQQAPRKPSAKPSQPTLDSSDHAAKAPIKPESESTSSNDATALATTLSTRLDALESTLGIPSTPLPPASSPSAPPLIPVLPALASLERHLALLTSATPSSLDALGARLRTLRTEADDLAAQRRRAHAELDELRGRAADAESATPTPRLRRRGTAAADDDEDEDDDAARPRERTGAGADEGGALAAWARLDPALPAQVGALHAALPTVDALAPLLPDVLGRLRALRGVHAAAADAGQRVDACEGAVARAREEVRGWREALGTVEARVAEMEERAGENGRVVEGWVRELEGRVERLGLGRGR